MKEQIALLLNGVIEALKADGKLPTDLEPNIQVENTRDKAHGDLATNLAMTLAKPARQNPRAIAEMILQALPESTIVDKAEIAGPGFINFFVNDAAIYSVVENVLDEADQFGRSKPRAMIAFRLNLSLLTQPGLCT